MGMKQPKMYQKDETLWEGATKVTGNEVRKQTTESGTWSDVVASKRG